MFLWLFQHPVIRPAPAEPRQGMRLAWRDVSGVMIWNQQTRGIKGQGERVILRESGEGCNLNCASLGSLNDRGIPYFN